MKVIGYVHLSTEDQANEGLLSRIFSRKKDAKT